MYSNEKELSGKYEKLIPIHQVTLQELQSSQVTHIVRECSEVEGEIITSYKYCWKFPLHELFSELKRNDNKDYKNKFSFDLLRAAYSASEFSWDDFY